jgi:hypothetical protein
LSMRTSGFPVLWPSQMPAAMTVSPPAGLGGVEFHSSIIVTPLQGCMGYNGHFYNSVTPSGVGSSFSVGKPTMASIILGTCRSAPCSLYIIRSRDPLIFSGGRMDRVPRPLCVGLALGCFRSIIFSKEIIERTASSATRHPFHVRRTRATGHLKWAGVFGYFCAPKVTPHCHGMAMRIVSVGKGYATEFNGDGVIIVYTFKRLFALKYQFR